MGQYTTNYIRDSYNWLRLMRMKRRWKPGRPTVMAVVGAELTRVTPSELAVAQPEPAPEVPQEEEAPKGRRNRRENQTTE